MDVLPSSGEPVFGVVLMSETRQRVTFYVFYDYLIQIIIHFKLIHSLPVFCVVISSLLLTSYEGGVNTGGFWVGSTLVAAMQK